MTEDQEKKLRSLEQDRAKCAGALTKAGKEDGAEIAYAESYKKIIQFKNEVGNSGALGVKRDKYRIGVS